MIINQLVKNKLVNAKFNKMIMFSYIFIINVFYANNNFIKLYKLIIYIIKLIIN
jgi:hypothetical protein